MALLIQQLREERQKIAELQKENNELRMKNVELRTENDQLLAENTTLKTKLSESKKKPVPLTTKAVVRQCYKKLNKEGFEFDFNFTFDHTDNVTIIERVVAETQFSDNSIELKDAQQAAKDMFKNLRDDRNRILRGGKEKQLKSVRRRNRMIQKMKSRKTAFDSHHCKLTEQEKSKAKVMFTDKMEYISSDEDDTWTETTSDGATRTIRTVRILQFESHELKSYKHSLDQTYREDLIPESRKANLTVLQKDPSVCPLSKRMCPPGAPQWAVVQSLKNDGDSDSMLGFNLKDEFK